MAATKIGLEVPADPIWRHVVAVTLLAAVRAVQAQSEPGKRDEQLSQMGDLSLLLDQALDEIENLPGVTTLLIEVVPDDSSALVTVSGSGEEVEPPTMPMLGVAAFAGPLTNSSFAWDRTTVTCSFRVS